MFKIFLKAAQTIDETLFPRVCAGCSMPNSNFCARCIEKLVLVRFKSCPSCAEANTDGRVCEKCRKKISLNGLMLSVRPTAEIKRAVHNYKYKNVSDLYLELATILSHAISKHTKRFDLITHVPLSLRRMRHRRYNHAELLAKEVSVQLNVPHQTVLKKIRNTHTQVGLSRQERLKNLADAFKCVSKEVRDRNILLIDDVATTLSTMNECSRVLKTAGAKSVWGAVLYKD